mmetsp:Transcript_9073/g.29811  ORF Transcript_9073/g.29811 Transcript_9073/m.29811 type:complete len:295 (+) Transcript_9073:2178-3062(+)
MTHGVRVLARGEQVVGKTTVQQRTELLLHRWNVIEQLAQAQGCIIRARLCQFLNLVRHRHLAQSKHRRVCCDVEGWRGLQQAQLRVEVAPIGSRISVDHPLSTARAEIVVRLCGAGCARDELDSSHLQCLHKPVRRTSLDASHLDEARQYCESIRRAHSQVLRRLRPWQPVLARRLAIRADENPNVVHREEELTLRQHQHRCEHRLACAKHLAHATRGCVHQHILALETETQLFAAPSHGTNRFRDAELFQLHKLATVVMIQQKPTPRGDAEHPAVAVPTVQAAALGARQSRQK